MQYVWSLLFQLVLNMALITGGFLTAGYLNRLLPNFFGDLPWLSGRSHSVLWLIAAVMVLPVCGREKR